LLLFFQAQFGSGIKLVYGIAHQSGIPMSNELEKYDLASLLLLYMEESKAFSEALNKGASWQALRERRLRIREISECINKKYKGHDSHSGRRRDDLPPHSSGK